MKRRFIPSLFSRFLGVRTLFAKRVCVFLTPFDTAEVACRFFFGTTGTKKKLTKRNAVTRALPELEKSLQLDDPHHLPKKVDENFYNKFLI
jgi:hypothetical protein